MGFFLSTFALLIAWSSSLEGGVTTSNSLIHRPPISLEERHRDSSINTVLFKNDTIIHDTDINGGQDTRNSSNTTVEVMKLPHWEWHRYGSSVTSIVQTQQPNVKTNSSQSFYRRYLIAQISTHYSNTSSHSIDGIDQQQQQILEITSRVNKAYARQWRYDFVKITLPESNTSTDNNNYRHNQSQHQTPPRSFDSIGNGLDAMHYISILRKLLLLENATDYTPSGDDLNETNKDLQLMKSGLDDTIEENNETILSTTATMTVNPIKYDAVWIFNDPSAMVANFEQNVFSEAFLTGKKYGHRGHTTNSIVAGVGSDDGIHWDKQRSNVHNNTTIYMQSPVASSSLPLLHEGMLLWNLSHPELLPLLDVWEHKLNNSNFNLSQALMEMTTKSSSLQYAEMGRMWTEIMSSNPSTIYHLPWTTPHEHLDHSSNANDQNHDEHSAVNDGGHEINPMHNEVDRNGRLRRRQRKQILSKKSNSSGTAMKTEDQHNKVSSAKTTIVSKDDIMIKLQSVGDLVCFRYFPQCDLI